MDRPLHPHLASSDAFAAVDAETLAALEPDLEVVRVPAGDVLIRQGEVGDAMYVLVTGTLEVRVDGAEGETVAVDRLRAGAAVGEMALVAGRRRSATVAAHEDSELVRLSREAFERLASTTPGLREAFLLKMAPRLQRVQLSAVLESWFGTGDHELVHALQGSVEWIPLAAGETLYEEGDDADGMYLVVGGRLGLTRQLEEGGTTSTEIGRGESVGEYAVLSDAPRTETVVALRDSHVVKLERDLVERHPPVIARIARTALERLRVGGRGGRARGNGVRSFAVIGGRPGNPTRAVARRLAEALSMDGRTLHVDARAVDTAFGREGAAQTGSGAHAEAALTHWLNEREAEHDHLVLEGDPGPSAWTNRCLRQADVVLLVVDAVGDPRPAPVEADAHRLSANVQLVLVHDDATPRPSGTAAWLSARPPLPFHHVRLGREDDTARLARRVTGRALGLVFSGGGARGYAHIGAIRSIEERGLPVDVVGGTSMGALVGGAYAMSREFAFCYGAAASFGDKRKLVDRTLPLVALTESRNVTRMLRHMFADTRIEDLWVPFFCVSANLTRAEPVIHRTGPLWEAVRASTAIPGVFTPLVHEGDVLVDGAIMNAFPVDLMRARADVGPVIGSNASSPNIAAPGTPPYAFGPSVSGWRVLFERLLPPSRRNRYPSMLGTLMRATSSSSKHLSATARALADLVIEYPTHEYGSLDFDHYDALVEIGYHEADAALAGWLETTEDARHLLVAGRVGTFAPTTSHPSHVGAADVVR